MEEEEEEEEEEGEEEGEEERVASIACGALSLYEGDDGMRFSGEVRGDDVDSE